MRVGDDRPQHDQPPPAFVLDPAETARLAAEKADENARFGGYLKHGLRWSEQRLDRAIHEAAETVERGVDCTTCGRCCREMSPSLTLAEIATLAGHLGIEEGQFLARYTAPGEGIDAGEVLLKSPCTFLAGTICSVYADRPACCREFPHLHKPLMRSRLLQVVNNADCPLVYNTLELLKVRLRRR